MAGIVLDSIGDIVSGRMFIHDDGQIVLDLSGCEISAAALAHRYPWGTKVDELLADETAGEGVAEDVAWALTDHQNSVRQLAAYDRNGTPNDPSDDSTEVVKQIDYDAFGNVVSDSEPEIASLFTLHRPLLRPRDRLAEQP